MFTWPWTKLDKPCALPSRDFPNREGEYTWEDYYEQTKAKYPMRYWWQETMPDFFRAVYRKVTNPFSKAYYWLRTHTVHRYHMLNLKCPTYGFHYEWGWFDRSELLFIAPFQILKSFVEDELPHAYVDWESDEPHSSARKEMQDLYDWWMTGRNKERDDMNAALDEGTDKSLPEKGLSRYRGPAWDAYIKESDRLETKDDEMLLRLIAVRKFLWT